MRKYLWQSERRKRYCRRCRNEENGLKAQIRIHPLLQDLAGGQRRVEVEGDNVGECLSDLERKFPGIHEKIFDKRGQLLKHVEIFINGKTTFPEELMAPVKDGDELSILMLLSGG